MENCSHKLIKSSGGVQVPLCSPETFAIDRDTNASNNILFNGANVIVKNYLENNKNEKYLSGSKHPRSITG